MLLTSAEGRQWKHPCGHNAPSTLSHSTCPSQGSPSGQHPQQRSSFKAQNLSKLWTHAPDNATSPPTFPSPHGKHCCASAAPAAVPGGPPVKHNHHLQICKESYLWTGGISTPERAQKVTTDCQSTCGHLWHADAIFLQFFSGHRAQH